ncbi:MAG: YtxH domain-containing protein [Acidobacteria bacterium]|nr:YtxH domain-containing protein [Acidobacteriota bacterium]MCA1608484.1 YtxH domain-containing protein [Acidobacteriota bacterium]
MRGIVALLGGLGAGAALMYLFDPKDGNRRRALIRDKGVKFNRITRETMSGRVHDLANRAKGMLHEAKSSFGPASEVSAEHPETLQ